MPTPVMLPMSCVMLKHHYSVILAFTLSRLTSVCLLDLFYLTSACRAKTRPKERHREERAALPPSDVFHQPEWLPSASRAPRAPRQSIGTQGCGTALSTDGRLAHPSLGVPELPWAGAGGGCRVAPAVSAPWAMLSHRLSQCFCAHAQNAKALGEKKHALTNFVYQHQFLEMQSILSSESITLQPALLLTARGRYIHLFK